MDRVFESIKSYLEAIFAKSSSSITEEEFASVTELPINGYDLELGMINLEDILSAFPNLKSISFTHYNVSNKDLEYLSKLNLDRLSFVRCGFEDASLLKNFNLKTLVINNSELSTLDFLKESMSEVEFLLLRPLNSGLGFDGTSLSNKKGVRQLVLENMNVKGLTNIEGFTELEYVSLLNSNLMANELGTLSSLPKLNRLYIDEDFDSLEEITSLKDKVDVRNDYLADMFIQAEEEEAPQKAL